MQTARTGPDPGRLELDPVQVSTYARSGESYRPLRVDEDRLVASAPFAVDLALAELLPRWAR